MKCSTRENLSTEGRAFLMRTPTSVLLFALATILLLFVAMNHLDMPAIFHERRMQDIGTFTLTPVSAPSSGVSTLAPHDSSVSPAPVKNTPSPSAVPGKQPVSIISPPNSPTKQPTQSSPSSTPSFMPTESSEPSTFPSKSSSSFG